MSTATPTVTTAALEKSKIAILGYGSQGRSHALNLRDSGLDVIVGLRAGGATAATAKADGFTVVEPAEAVKQAEVLGTSCAVPRTLSAPPGTNTASDSSSSQMNAPMK